MTSAISNRRLISADETGITFKWKDYRIEGPDRYKTIETITGRPATSVRDSVARQADLRRATKANGRS